MISPSSSWEMNGGIPRRIAPPRPTPRPYVTKIFSIYVEDLERADAMVAELKARGHSKMSRSKLIRIALSQLDIDAIEREA